jgi:outer membrane protein assembly factor BamC
MVKQENKKGLFSKLAFWSGDTEAESKQYQIKLTEDGPDTRTTVLDAEGNPETSATAVRILNLLYEKLK